MAVYSASPRIIFITSSMSAFTSSMPATSSKRTPVSRRSTPTLNSRALCRPNSSASSCTSQHVVVNSSHKLLTKHIL